MKRQRAIDRVGSRRGGGAALGAAVLLCGWLGAPAAAGADGAPMRPEMIEPAAGGLLSTTASADLVSPKILGAADSETYRKIFRLQTDGRWRDADREIVRLQDRLLMGHVLLQRYMHPTKYRSKYVELKTWLDAYADHPGAYRVYRLAIKRRPAGAAAPRRPQMLRRAVGYADVPATETYRSPRKRSRAIRREVRRVQRLIRQNLRRDRISVSENYLARPSVQKLLDSVELDELRAQVAAARFYYGDPERAYELASEAAEDSREHLSYPDWIAGLAAWRNGNYLAARRHFEALALSKVASPWNASAGAYWAARAYLVTGRPAPVNGLLQRAAKHPRTFYGLIAARQLGTDLGLHWQPPELSTADYAALIKFSAVRRSVALAQADAFRKAELELRKVYLTADPSLGQPLLALAHQLELPAMQLRLARGIRSDSDRPFDRALFPLPPWRPSTGFEVDQALIFAFMRQESAFKPRAKSSVGARGLMQLMPRTASFVAKDRSLRWRNSSKLFDPEFNLQLGQQYVSHLLDHALVNGDLFKLAIAYNAGPGNLQRWMKRIGYEKDPLLFIEMIPSRETRIFVERVLTNFWIYRERLNQDTPSLDAVATGHTPVYLALDGSSLRIVENAGDSTRR